jgi:hypothetical protein
VRPIFRTFGQRRRRARKAQVSAVATTLGLLLVVLFISNYLVFQLPGQMSQEEFDHEIQVEDQLERFQGAIDSESVPGFLPFGVSSPVTLGSQGVPPFGPPSLGAIGPEPNSVGTKLDYVLNGVRPATPNWGVDSSCLPAGAGTCSANSAVDSANLSANGTSSTVKITGTGDSLVYNVDGDNDTFSFQWSGSNEGVTDVVINGSYDTVTLTKSGTDAATPSISFLFYGIHDVFKLSMAGSHTAPSGTLVNVQFIGSQGLLCPFDNGSATDSIGTMTAGGSKLNLTVAWWNAVGYTSPGNVTEYPGNTNHLETVTWENETGFVACPFLVILPHEHVANDTGALQVSLFNRYLPGAILGYEDGAVLLQNPGDPAVMVSDPDFSFNETVSGFTANLVLPQLVGPTTSESGTQTAALISRVVDLTQYTFGTGADGLFVGTPFFLNITTEFPAAWMNYFNNEGNAFPNGANCYVVGAPLPPSYSCLQPPAGRTVEISAPLYAQVVTVTVLQVDVSLI